MVSTSHAVVNKINEMARPLSVEGDLNIQSTVGGALFAEFRSFYTR